MVPPSPTEQASVVLTTKDSESSTLDYSTWEPESIPVHGWEREFSAWMELP